MADSGTFEVDINMNIDLESASSPSEFISDEKHVILETNDSCLINGIGRMEIADDTIVLQSGQEVFTFDMNGKWLSNFMRQGQGPEEYIQIDGLRVKSGIVYILDRNSKKIIAYTPNGDFVKSVKLNYDFVDFYIPNDQQIVLASGYYNQSMHNFIWIDSETGEIISELAPYDSGQTVSFDNYIPFSGMGGDDLIVNTLFSHSDYRLTLDSFEILQKFNFNTSDKLPDFTTQNLNISDILNHIRQSGYTGVTQLGYFTSSKTFNYLSFSYRTGIKNTNAGFLANIILKYDMNGEVKGFLCPTNCNSELCPYFHSFRYLTDGKIISVVNSDDLISKDEDLGISYWKSKGLTEDSNPVVFIYTLK